MIGRKPEINDGPAVQEESICYSKEIGLNDGGNGVEQPT